MVACCKIVAQISQSLSFRNTQFDCHNSACSPGERCSTYCTAHSRGKRIRATHSRRLRRNDRTEPGARIDYFLSLTAWHAIASLRDRVRKRYTPPPPHAKLTCVLRAQHFSAKLAPRWVDYANIPVFAAYRTGPHGGDAQILCSRRRRRAQSFNARPSGHQNDDVDAVEQINGYTRTKRSHILRAQEWRWVSSC